MQRKWVVTGWMAAAAVAVVAGIGAVALAQGGTLDPPTEPMSEESVQQALDDSESNQPSDDASASESPSPTPSDEPDATPSPGAGEQVFGGAGGTFLASCDGTQVTIESWTPSQGWQVSNVESVPAADAEIEFESESDEEEYSVRCVDGVPQLGSADDDTGDDSGDDG